MSKTRRSDIFVLSLSSALGLGYMPKAAGTWGTLAALPIWWGMAALPLWGQVALVAAVALFAIAVSARAEVIYGKHDVGKIVIDEVAGMLVACIAVPFRWPEVLAAFLLFRLFDILKPPPIGWLDRRVGGGTGVVLDDLIAGLFALGLMHLARLLLGGWW